MKSRMLANYEKIKAFTDWCGQRVCFLCESQGTSMHVNLTISAAKRLQSQLQAAIEEYDDTEQSIQEYFGENH